MYVALPRDNLVLIYADSENYSIALYIEGWVIIKTMPRAVYDNEGHSVDYSTK